MKSTTIVGTLLLASTTVDAFVQKISPINAVKDSLVKVNNGASGGWGVSNSREMVEAEFMKGNRKGYEPYQLQGQKDFMEQLKRENDNLVQEEEDELLAVAKFAGFDVSKRKRKPKKLGKFNNVDLDLDDEPLDLRVVWDEDENKGGADSSINVFETDGLVPTPEQLDQQQAQRQDADSATRLDEDTGAPGVW